MIGMFKGLATTLSVFTRKPVTVKYPDERHVLPVRQRSFPVLTWDFDHDEPFCTGCNVCVRNCPVDCMTATMIDNPKYAEGTSDRRKIVEKFWIDYARCMRCNICVEVCPFEAIVMDNNWSGHEHASYDRLDLHMDLEDLLRPSKSGELTQPFRPQDRIEYVERVARGEEPPETAFKGALPEARQRQQERLARGEEAAIRLREPQQPKESKKGGAAAGAAAGAGAQSLLVDAEGNPLSDRKIRAKRMKAERAAKEAQDKGEAIPDDVMQMLIATKSDMAPADAKAAAAPSAGAAPAAPGASPLLQDAEGNPLSENKIRAKRIKAERSAKEAQDKGEAIPDDVMQMLIATDSDMAPAEAKAAAASAAPAAAPAGPDTSSPLLQDAEGNPLSENKIRAKRIKAERTAKESQDKGEAIPDDVMQMLVATGSELAPQPAGGGGGAPAAEAAPAGPDTSHPELQDAEGNPLSENKIRAKRMKAEKQAKEHLASGEAIPDDLQALIKAAGGTVPTSAE